MKCVGLQYSHHTCQGDYEVIGGNELEGSSHFTMHMSIKTSLVHLKYVLFVNRTSVKLGWGSQVFHSLRDTGQVSQAGPTLAGAQRCACPHPRGPGAGHAHSQPPPPRGASTLAAGPCLTVVLQWKLLNATACLWEWDVETTGLKEKSVSARTTKLSSSNA